MTTILADLTSLVKYAKAGEMEAHLSEVQVEQDDVSIKSSILKFHEEQSLKSQWAARLACSPLFSIRLYYE